MAFAADKTRQATAGTGGDFTIDYSCRFNAADDAYLSRTQGTPTDGKKWVWSAWVKRGALSNAILMRGWTGGAYEETNEIRFTSNTLAVEQYKGSSGDNYYYWRLATDMLFRDVSAWYHICVSYDSTQTTDTNRIKIYVNGSVQTVNHPSYHSHADFPTEDFEPWINEDGSTAQIGRLVNENEFDGHMAEVHFIDGLSFFSADDGTASTSLNIDTFGETGDYGEWKPKEVSGVTYGNNGFYLDFADSGALGDDESGNTNDFTVTNLVASDQMLDTPTNNFCTLNPLDTTSTLQEGNLKSAPGGSHTSTSATLGASSGKWYFEYKCTSAGQYQWVGALNISTGAFAGDTDVFSNSNSWSYSAYSGWKWQGGGFWNGSSYGTSWASGTSHIIGCALDLDNNKIYWSYNGTWQASGDPAAGTNAAFTNLTEGYYVPCHSGASSAGVFNFGQDSSFAGEETAQGNQDGNSIGDFYYTPPTGFLAMCTANLDTPAVIPSKHFNVTTYTGNASTQSITGVGFQPDFLWIKKSSLSERHQVMDAIRGVNSQIQSAEGDSEETATDRVTSFDSDGFSLGADAGTKVNAANGAEFVAWSWKANGSGSANTDGDMAETVTVSANVNAGFSIIKYTGDGATATIGHGLSKAPEMIIIKNIDQSADIWRVYHSGIASDAETDWMVLSNNAASIDHVDEWNDTAPASSVFTVGTANETNRDDDDFIAYCFHSVDGHSKVGSYIGNNSTDGTFVYTGFRPAFVMIKHTTISAGWVMWDNKRDTTNFITKLLYADTNAAEGSGADVDFLSNGFKLRDSEALVNHGSAVFIYLAFAETPFKYSNAK